MIDAYEVGIQLALQDGVSSGLEVIGRELAELDKAVAASSAGLTALTQAARGAVQAVAAAASVRAPAVAAAGGAQAERTGSEPSASAPSHRPDEVVSAAPTPASVERLPAESTAGGPPAVAVAPQRGEGGQQHPLGAAAQPAVEPSASASAVAPVVVQQAVAVEAGTGTEVAARPAPERGTVAPVSESRRQGAAASAAAQAPAAPVGQGTAPQRVSTRLPMQASVADAIAPRPRPAPSGTEMQPRRPETTSLNMSVSMPGRSSVPAASTQPGEQGPQRSATGADRAVAPQPPQGREQGEAGGGTVMLDGHLVGYWLSEQMARQASRPAAGTTFFDPRQTPAWMPSGAL